MFTVEPHPASRIELRSTILKFPPNPNDRLREGEGQGHEEGSGAGFPTVTPMTLFFNNMRLLTTHANLILRTTLVVFERPLTAFCAGKQPQKTPRRRASGPNSFRTPILPFLKIIVHPFRTFKFPFPAY